MVADLFGGDPLGVQQDSKALVAEVSGAVGPGEFQCVAYATFGRQFSGVHGWAEVEGDLYVAQFHGGIDSMFGDQASMASNYHHLGMLAQARGDYEEAARQYQRSLDISERLGDQASSYHQLGMLAQARGARDIDLERGNLHIAFNYLVKNGQRVRKDTRTHPDRYLAIDPVTSAMLREHLDVIRAGLADFGLELPQEA